MIWNLRFRYACPFCRSRFRDFLPSGLDIPVLRERRVVGGGRRRRALCPACGSLDRERLVYLFLRCRTDLFEGEKRVLHVAPEKRLAEILRSRDTLHYLTADLLSDDVMRRVDITHTDFPDDAFDVVICNHVLEHVVDDRKAMSELHRILKPGGWAVLQVPLSLILEKTHEDDTVTTVEGRERAFGQGDHVRIYGKDYTDRLADAGLRVEVFRWTSDPAEFGGPKNRYGLNEEESVFLVYKDLRWCDGGSGGMKTPPQGA
jgi:SAM-dependent methyltransferase